jgi:hypothetical protein
MHFCDFSLHVLTERWWGRSACRKCKTLKSVGEILNYPCNHRKLAFVSCHTLWQKLLQPSPKDTDGNSLPFQISWVRNVHTPSMLPCYCLCFIACAGGIHSLGIAILIRANSTVGIDFFLLHSRPSALFEGLQLILNDESVRHPTPYNVSGD